VWVAADEKLFGSLKSDTPKRRIEGLVFIVGIVIIVDIVGIVELDRPLGV
jgi:hypothetical protein